MTLPISDKMPSKVIRNQANEATLIPWPWCGNGSVLLGVRETSCLHPSSLLVTRSLLASDPSHRDITSYSTTVYAMPSQMAINTPSQAFFTLFTAVFYTMFNAPKINYFTMHTNNASLSVKRSREGISRYLCY